MDIPRNIHPPPQSYIVEEKIPLPSSSLAMPHAYPSRTMGVVISEFKAGKFEQTLEGTLFNFPVPSGKNTAATAGNPNGAQDGDQGRPVPLPRPNSGSSYTGGVGNATNDPTNRAAAINNNNGAASASANQTDSLRNRSRSPATRPQRRRASLRTDSVSKISSSRRRMPSSS